MKIRRALGLAMLGCALFGSPVVVQAAINANNLGAFSCSLPIFYLCTFAT